MCDLSHRRNTPSEAGCNYAEMSTPRVEPGLSWPQCDVLTTRRCGLLRVDHLGDVALSWVGRSVNEELARMLPVLPLGFAAVCECWRRVFWIIDRGFQDALPAGGHV